MSTLGELLDALDSLDDDLTIYAHEPWRSDSEAVAAREPADGGLPVDAREKKLSYFLEVSIAKEVLEDWLASQEEPAAPAARVDRLIHYATYDA